MFIRKNGLFSGKSVEFKNSYGIPPFFKKRRGNVKGSLRPDVPVNAPD